MESIEQKQQYLCQHIIDGGYDPEEFTVYCERLMGSIDLAGWSFSDLEHMVKGFVSVKSSQAVPQSNQQSHFSAEPKEEARMDTGRSECPPTPSTVHSFRKEDLDHLLSITFPAQASQQQQGILEKAVSSNPTSEPSEAFKPDAAQPPTANLQQPAASKYSFDDIFKGIGPPASKQGPAGFPTTPPSVGNINIFETEEDEPPRQFIKREESVPPLRSTLSSTMEQAVLKKPKQHSSPQKQQPPRARPAPKQSHKEVIKCVKAAERQFLGRTMQVEVRGHEIVNRNFFVPDYVLYHVFTRGINVEVKRKYDHFQRLRSILAKLYPCCRLPYLQKNTWLSETDIEFIKKQKTMLQCFLNDLLMNRQIKNSRVLEDFLTITEHTKVKNALTEYEALPKPRSLEELTLLGGEVELQHSEQAQACTSKVVPYFASLADSIGKFLKLSEQLSLNYNVLIKTFSELGDLITGIAQSTHQLRDSLQSFEIGSQLPQVQELERTFLSFANFYEELSNTAKFEQRLLDSQLRPLLRFEKENVLTLGELTGLRDRLADQLLRLQEQKEPPKDASIRTAELQKTPIDEPSRIPSVLRQQTAFYNWASLSESNRLLGDTSTKLQSRLRQMAAQCRQRWSAQQQQLSQLGQP